tara:strand:- start:128 stop:583 length:456 start_codon:yes stop_codon:yes gene_type:complete
MKVDGKPVHWPHVFVADKAAYDAAVLYLKERGLNPDMFTEEDDYPIIESPLCQKLLVEGHPFEISLYRGVDEPEWILEITNANGTSFIPDEQFKTDKDALKQTRMHLAQHWPILRTNRSRTFLGSPASPSLLYRKCCIMHERPLRRAALSA